MLPVVMRLQGSGWNWRGGDASDGGGSGARVKDQFWCSCIRG